MNTSSQQHAANSHTLSDVYTAQQNTYQDRRVQLLTLAPQNTMQPVGVP